MTTRELAEKIVNAAANGSYTYLDTPIELIDAHVRGALDKERREIATELRVGPLRGIHAWADWVAERGKEKTP